MGKILSQMATILLFPFLLKKLQVGCAIFKTEAQQGESIVSQGSFLTPITNSSWLSRSGLYAFGFYQQANGYAVGVFLARILEKTVVWTANQDHPPILVDATLNFTTNGRLILQSAQGKETNIANPSDVPSASMLDLGNFVLYNSNNKISWQSFDYPTNTLVQNQRLTAGKELVSSVSESDQSTGIFCLAMQTDGHLVQYPVGTPNIAKYSYWASGTMNQGSDVSLCLDDDGHLYLCKSNVTYLINLTQGGYPTNDTVYFMRIDADGIFRLYSHNLNKNGNWSRIWSSSNGKCDPKGLCGLNGFASVNQGKWSSGPSGCERNFTPESCKSRDGSIKYTMEPISNIKWEFSSSFSILSSLTEEECQAACWEDCNCEAAMYNDSTCRKLKLPLIFGRIVPSDSNKGFIKVGMSTSTINNNMPMGSQKKHPNDIMIISISLAAFELIMLNCVWGYKRLPDSGNVGLSVDFCLRSFTYLDIEKMTNGFKKQLGRGSFGTVYKGTKLNGQKLVAVKRLENVLAEGEKEFQTEINVIDGESKLLVYEYMSNGSLADILFKPERQLCRDERIEIACNIAKGIIYLHEDCESQIIHYEYGCAKISDFGLAKLLKVDQTNTFTSIQGTKGYVAPEWHQNQLVSIKVDVYSFGIVLLELLCCRRNAYHCFEAHELGKLVSDKEIDKRQLQRMVKVGLWCILDDPSLRPSIKKVLLMLEGNLEIPIPPSSTLSLSSE
ncbi:hypothetical protein ACB092_10G155200 [Castanea dentata]